MCVSHGNSATATRVPETAQIGASARRAPPAAAPLPVGGDVGSVGKPSAIGSAPVKVISPANPPALGPATNEDHQAAEFGALTFSPAASLTEKPTTQQTSLKFPSGKNTPVPTLPSGRKIVTPPPDLSASGAERSVTRVASSGLAPSVGSSQVSDKPSGDVSQAPTTSVPSDRVQPVGPTVIAPQDPKQAVEQAAVPVVRPVGEPVGNIVVPRPLIVPPIVVPSVSESTSAASADASGDRSPQHIDDQRRAKIRALFAEAVQTMPTSDTSRGGERLVALLCDIEQALGRNRPGPNQMQKPLYRKALITYMKRDLDKLFQGHAVRVPLVLSTLFKSI